MSKPAAPAEAPAADAAKPAGAKSKKLMIIGIIVGIMIVEMAAIVLVMPRGAATDAHAATSDEDSDEHGDHAEAKVESHAPAKEAKGHGGGHGKKEEHGATAAPVKNASATGEVDLGEFSVTSYQPAASTTLFISFHLFGTLQNKNSDELQRRLDDNKHRIRDNIIVIIRSAEIADLTDAGLGLIKRRILETTNKTLGKPLLQAVVFSEFSFVEQ